jgi:hypothetical protein
MLLLQLQLLMLPPALAEFTYYSMLQLLAVQTASSISAHLMMRMPSPILRALSRSGCCPWNCTATAQANKPLMTVCEAHAWCRWIDMYAAGCKAG